MQQNPKCQQSPSRGPRPDLCRSVLMAARFGQVVQGSGDPLGGIRRPLCAIGDAKQHDDRLLVHPLWVVSRPWSVRFTTIPTSPPGAPRPISHSPDASSATQAAIPTTNPATMGTA